MTTELLAQVLEVTSIMAARRQIAKPLSVPRPSHIQEQRAASIRAGMPVGDRDRHPEMPRVMHDPDAPRDPRFTAGLDAFKSSAKVVR